MTFRLPRSFVKRGRLPYVILTGIFIVFLGAIMYGGRLIYQMEVRGLDAAVSASLSRDASAVREFFSDCANDLRLIAQVPGVRDVLEREGVSQPQRLRVTDVLTLIASSHPSYRRIRLIGSNGMERVALVRSQDSGAVFVPVRLLRDRRTWEFFSDAAAAGRRGIYAAFLPEIDGIEAFSGGTRGGPAVVLSLPVFNEEGATAGLIVLDIPLDRLLEQLSPGTFFQDDRSRIIAQPDGATAVADRPHAFAGSGGALVVSDSERMVYRSVEYLAGRNVWMAHRFSVMPFKLSMIKLVAVAVLLLILFFLCVLLLVFYNQRYLRNIANVQKAIIHSLANLSEWRDPETGSHLERTRNTSLLLAKTLRKRPEYQEVITTSFMEALYDAVPLHDVGKVGIRDDILLKASKLDIQEFEVMKRHVTIGQDIIEGIMERFRAENEFLTVSRNICYYHHEKFDGSGYPQGLHGEQIPLEARIFAICDVYDALRARRPYKSGMGHEETVQAIVAERGRHFDPAVVDAFLACSSEFYEMFEVYRIFDDTYGKLMKVRSNDALKIAWTQDLSVGIDLVDVQHMEFIRHANVLFGAVLLGEGRRAALRALDFLREYAVLHFATEEALMRKHEFPDFVEHQHEHLTFVDRLAKLREELSLTDAMTSSQVVKVNAYVVDWLITHIIISDKGFGSYLSAREPALTARIS